MITNTELTSLFMQSTVSDAMADYRRSVADADYPHWDAVVLTASNAAQAEGYQKQLEYRKDRLPGSTAFFVVPDLGDKRVGSAGSTLSVIRRLKQEYGSFADKKILVIHAGGNSSRCPQYSAVGKLFAPFPAELDGHPATLFDSFMVTLAGMPGRMKNGMLLLSGDVALLFNPLMCDFGDADAAVISFREDVETGKDHGVYIKNSETGNVKSFLHKKPVEELRAMGAVDGQDTVAIDTGAIWLSPAVLNSLYTLIDTDEKYNALVNDQVRLSLYSDIAYCLAEDSTRAAFQKETPEGTFCPELSAARDVLWQAIGGYTMKLLTLSPAKFLHFGAIPEIMAFVNHGVAGYADLGWARQVCSAMPDDTAAAYNAVVASDAVVGEGSYIEVCDVHSGAVVGKNAYVSYMTLQANDVIPNNVLVHGLKLRDGVFVCRIMGVNDNPKKDKLFGIALDELSQKLVADLGADLWNAPLYPVCATIHDALRAALNLYALCTGNGDLGAWQQANKVSLCAGFNLADAQSIIDFGDRLSQIVTMENLGRQIRAGVPVNEIQGDFARLTAHQETWLRDTLSRMDLSDAADFSHAFRLQYYLGILYHNDALVADCFRTIADGVVNHSSYQPPIEKEKKILLDGAETYLPLRVNWGGGWTDTCPYCLEQGGIVLNAAVTINGEDPVQVEILKTEKKTVSFVLWDMDARGEFDTIEPLQKTGDPFDSFALPKACLLACGIIPRSGGNLQELLTEYGGGFEIRSGVKNIPKGSGLGTSSILAAAMVSAFYWFFGIAPGDDVVIRTVLAVEQIMSTGGGWQDQVGGLVPGIKLISSGSGFDQELTVQSVKVPAAAMQELSERFAIIYTGQRRLARNLLRDVVGRYIGNVPDSVFAHNEIKNVALRMRDALVEGNIDEFARLMDYHWELLGKIDSGITNSLIDTIFTSIADLIDARMCCGAGGGGFLQVILKKGVSHAQVHERLKQVFGDFPVDVWTCSFG